jgi:hypothetical protein
MLDRHTSIRGHCEGDEVAEVQSQPLVVSSIRGQGFLVSQTRSRDEPFIDCHFFDLFETKDDVNRAQIHASEFVLCFRVLP